MRAHCWIEFRGTRKIAGFVVAIIAVALYSAQLPAEAWTRMRGGRFVLPPLPFVMIAAWVGGWFAALFLRAEDLRVVAPINYQALYRGIAIAVIAFGSCVAGLLYLRYLSQ